jgi:deoxyribodipyrimidine photo-lyase
MADRPTPHTKPYALHWFRRDLRVAGNPALEVARERFDGRVVGFFCFDSKFLARPDFSPDRFGFFLETMRALRDDLRAGGGDLLVLDVGPQEAFERLFDAFRRAHVARPSLVTFNRDYEPFARERDARVSTLLSREHGIEVRTERDHLLIEPDELVRDGKPGGFYQVYTPFSRRWLERLQTEEVRSRLADAATAVRSYERHSKTKAEHKQFHLTWSQLFGDPKPPADKLDEYLKRNRPQVRVELPPAGTKAALDQLRLFGRRGLDDYAVRRDLPAVAGTSQMSIYLKNGSITTAQILATLGLEDTRPPAKRAANKKGSGDKESTAAAPAAKTADKKPDSRTTYVKELAWREFYYHILHHRPDVEGTAFLEKYRGLRWSGREAWFEAWKEGRTGFPIVDAGMRQLNETGWMHNRVRMIVASFLTKDLLIDWRWGERYFMERLLDGDLAPNNGGWQWAASTGCDPQPYFRVFNPRLQGEKFDPEGEYVRRWVPELAAVSAKQIHAPHEGGYGKKYVAPIVDHAEQKKRALAMCRGR